MDIITVNHIAYNVIRLLGHGKGGYSYLVEKDGCQYVLKQIHHEPCNYYSFGTGIFILTLFPGIQREYVDVVMQMKNLRALVIKTYGSGNAPQKPWFIKLLKEATERGIVIVNISQCPTGMVEMGRYETGLHLLDAGVISGYDSTVEALITKLMFLLGHGKSDKEIRELMNQPIAGEFTKI